MEKITASDISNGRLKAVLSLFFALSRYKQETKQKIANQRNVSIEISPNIWEETFPTEVE